MQKLRTMQNIYFENWKLKLNWSYDLTRALQFPQRWIISRINPAIQCGTSVMRKSNSGSDPINGETNENAANTATSRRSQPIATNSYNCPRVGNRSWMSQTKGWSTKMLTLFISALRTYRRWLWPLGNKL